MIAERVMGYPRSRHLGSWTYDLPEGGYLIERDLPHYSTRIQDAWLVVDAKEWELQMVVHKKGKSAGKTGAILSFDLFMEERYGVLGDTPAHAICLAALEAVSHE